MSAGQSTDVVVAVVGGTQGVWTSGQDVSMVSASGQAIAGAVSASAPIGGAIAVNPAAGLITLVKIGIDAKHKNEVNFGDAISIVGNSLSVVAAVCAVVPGGQPIALTLAVIGRGLAVAGIVASMLDVNYPLQNRTDQLISPILLTNPDPLIKEIKYFPWVDPLVLDLDGDGLEISPLSQGVQFDTNADTIRTATAWVGADDGLLVLDRNGNGQIDSARELFGDETLLADGKKASHGFAALAELDVGGAVGATGGAGDGVFDAKDAQFGAVRIWRDLNQDGISQAGEMQTMAEAGIASVKLASTATETSYGDAQLVQSGSFVRTDGSDGQAGSFILAVDNAVATHPPIAVSAEAAALPQVQGSGWVRGPQVGTRQCSIRRIQK